MSYWELASLGGQPELGHWQAAREVVTELGQTGRLRPTNAWMLADMDAKIAELSAD